MGDKEALVGLFNWFSTEVHAKQTVPFRPARILDFARFCGVSTKQAYRWFDSAGPVSMHRKLQIAIKTSISKATISDSQKKIGWALLDAVTSWRSEPATHVHAISFDAVSTEAVLRHGDPSDEYLLKLGKEIENAFDHGAIENSLGLMKLVWARLSQRRDALDPDLIQLGLVYQRLLITQRKYWSAVEVARACYEVATTDGNVTRMAFAGQEFINGLYHRRLADDAMDGWCPDPSVVGRFRSLEQLLSSRASSANADKVDWALNHNHRSAIAYITIHNDPSLVTEDDRELLRSYATKLGHSRRNVDQKENWRTANVLSQIRIDAVLDEHPEAVLERCQTILDSVDHAWDNMGLRLSMVIALRRLGHRRHINEARDLLLEMRERSEMVQNEHRVWHCDSVLESIDSSAKTSP